METIAYHPLLEVQQEDVKKVRQFFDLDDVNRIKESLEAIEEWCKKQPHLVEAFQYLRTNMLERLWILSRGSVEGTKIKIDKFLTMRGMTPELSLNKSYEEFENFLDCVLYVPLPKLCPTDQSRVMVTQIISGKWEHFSLLSYLRYCFMIGEYRLHHDYCLSERYIIDLSNVNIQLLTKLNPIILKKGEILCTEGYGTKIKGIHILNAPSFVDKFVFLIKQGLKEKVAKRLHVHSSYEELYKEIPKEILPKDYGGDGPSCANLAEKWKNVFKTDESKKIIDQCNKLVTDESKRSSVKFNEEYLGLPGSFRRLDVD
ncbi:alpha-tocopherol transfer protein-like [Vanessa atalanta]|uniref:alpha-tocopherol transfer protein-like n=1 Tax=Vanessa atalanta TaxID=42275 RepID=UPI001FCD5C5C|nr:alpha-tocopherol transfer protein-like [Vanessa atalanta]